MLPLCVHVDPDTHQLVADGEFSAECTGYVLITPADWAGSMTVAKLFDLPDPVMASAAFTTPFMLTLALAYVANAVGAVAGFWDSVQEEL